MGSDPLVADAMGDVCDAVGRFVKHGRAADVRAIFLAYERLLVIRLALLRAQARASGNIPTPPGDPTTN